jgi:glutamate-ammonia-ligase adenylyltransferase
MKQRVRTRVRFDDPRRAERNLNTFNEIIIRSTPDIDRDDLVRTLLSLLAECADADMALTNFLRFLETSFTPTSLLHDFARHAVLRELLIKIFSSSQYFSDILVRDPELFRWLTTTDALSRERTYEQYRAEAWNAVTLFEKTERKINALKRLYRREILRIGVRDLLGTTDVVGATRELSFLADAIIDCMAQLAVAELAHQYGSRPVTPWVILGLGKLGGEELNYSSDIDLMVVYGEEGEFQDTNGRTIHHHEFFIRMTEIVVQWMMTSTSEGTLYRIDLRLRPDGNAGPLARSIESMFLYYESRGEQWERQMLIKARPVAGDREFGERFLARLDPFIYPRTFFRNPTAEIARIKARIEQDHADDANIKLCPGGIRDIEFIAQALQLINAGKNPELHQRNTLNALGMLRGKNLLTANEYTTLTGAYILFRNVEHRLQIMHDVQTHRIPTSTREMTKLARRLSMPDGKYLADKIRTTRLGVRTIFDSVIGSRSPEGKAGFFSASEVGIEGLVLPTVFTQVKEAKKNLRILTSGSSSSDRREYDSRTRDAFLRIAPLLMEHLSASINPDLGLANLARLVSRLKFPEQLYSVLQEKSFCSLLVKICSVSPRIVTLFIHRTLFLDILMGRTADVLSTGEFAGIESFTLYDYRYFQEMRSAIRDILGLSTLEVLTAELTITAENIVRTLFTQTITESGISDPKLAVIALGKFGGKEISFDSDLDLIFVSSGETLERLEAMREICQTLISRLTAVTDAGRLYDVDARLRPEGRNAPLVTPIEAFRVYYGQRAALWEFQSLVKARAISGDPHTIDETERAIRSVLSSRKYHGDDFRSIVEMRRKTETRSRVRAAGFYDIKFGVGGMMDIEFLAQTYCLKRIGEGEAIEATSTLASLQDALSLGYIPQDEFNFLENSYREYRRIEKYMRLALETGSTSLPEAGQKADFLAKCVGMADFRQLAKELDSRMREVRKIFLHRMERFSERALP